MSATVSPRWKATTLMRPRSSGVTSMVSRAVKTSPLPSLGRDRIGRPNPCLCVVRPCDESALGIAAAHRAILTTSAASDMISRVAGPASSSSPASLPVRAASAKITR